MNVWNFLTVIFAVILIMPSGPFCFGAVNPEEAAELGTTLTGVGAERAGNAEGTIPEYAGGLTMLPPDFKAGSGVRPDPFEGEGPLFSIHAKNMEHYAEKLTDGTKALMKKYPTFRIDVYKTHRTVAFPDYVIKNTAKNALQATTYNSGLSIKGARAGIPFPIPKNGYEVMWNHLLRYRGVYMEMRYSGWFVDAGGNMTNTGQQIVREENPYYVEDLTKCDPNVLWKEIVMYLGPPRMAGQIFLVIDPINIYESERTAYMYVSGQRRVKLAPGMAFDVPDSSTGGNSTFDEAWLFDGSMERYDMKLMGKKELYIPYNAYKTSYKIKKEELFGTKHMNPDKVRWELHRVWVVEAALKSGSQHIYPKRRFYLDEDSWTILAGDNHNINGELVKANFAFQMPSYEVPAPFSGFFVSYNLAAGTYVGQEWPGEDGYVCHAKVFSERDWTPAGISALGIR